MRILQERKEKRGRKPGRKASAEKVDVKAKLGLLINNFSCVCQRFLFPFFFEHFYQNAADKVLANVALVKSCDINILRNLLLIEKKQ